MYRHKRIYFDKIPETCALTCAPQWVKGFLNYLIINQIDIKDHDTDFIIEISLVQIRSKKALERPQESQDELSMEA